MGGRVYDFILCDNVMPNMIGPDAVERIRAMGYTSPILGVTGNMVKSDVDDFLAHGCNEVLAKPLRKDALSAALTRMHITAGSAATSPLSPVS
jgi:CheY-like chemotaxis protein